MAGTRDINREFDELKNDFIALRKDLKNLSSAGGAAAQDALSDAKVKLEQEAKRIMSDMQSVAKGAKREGQQLMHDVEHQVEERPVGSMMTVLGIGFAIGWLIGRK